MWNGQLVPLIQYEGPFLTRQASPPHCRQIILVRPSLAGRVSSSRRAVPGFPDQTSARSTLPVFGWSISSTSWPLAHSVLGAILVEHYLAVYLSFEFSEETVTWQLRQLGFSGRLPSFFFAIPKASSFCLVIHQPGSSVTSSSRRCVERSGSSYCTNSKLALCHCNLALVKFQSWQDLTETLKSPFSVCNWGAKCIAQSRIIQKINFPGTDEHFVGVDERSGWPLIPNFLASFLCCQSLLFTKLPSPLRVSCPPKWTTTSSKC